MSRAAGAGRDRRAEAEAERDRQADLLADAIGRVAERAAPLHCPLCLGTGGAAWRHDAGCPLAGRRDQPGRLVT